MKHCWVALSVIALILSACTQSTPTPEETPTLAPTPSPKVISTPTPTPYSKADLTMTYLGIRAVGNAGALTTIPVPVTGLVDNALQQITPHVSISAPMAITSLLAETSLAQAKDSDGVMVVKVNID